MREDIQAASTRIVTLDALRGFAVMGILAMNIVAFAMPEMAYVSPKAYGGETSSDLAAWALGFLLFDGKMRGLFSILFGASLLLIVDRADISGQSPASVHYRRMAWLAIFGLCHYFFIWWGDILFLYAAVGCIAFLFRNWQPQRLIKWALGLFTLGVVLTSLFFGAQLAIANAPYDPSSPMAEARREIRGEYAQIDNEITREIALYRGPYLPILDARLDTAANPFVGVLMTILETLPLMLLGMALFRNGFLTGGWTTSKYRQVARRWLPPGVLLTLLIGWLQWRAGFDYLVSLNAMIAWAGPGRLMMTISYAALLVLLIQRARASPWVARVAAAGRMAFSNYLGTSIAMTTIFYGYGLGLFGDVGRWTLYLVCGGMWAVMLLWSKPWLDRFRYGPLEWLWRSLARGALQPMRQ